MAGLKVRRVDNSGAIFIERRGGHENTDNLVYEFVDFVKNLRAQYWI